MLTQPLLNARHSDREFWFAGVANDVFVRQLEPTDRTISHTRLALVEREQQTVDDRLQEEIAKFKRIASRFSMHLNDDLRHRLIAQFTMLLDPDEWDDEEPLPSEASENSLFRALAFMKPRMRPALGLAGANIIGMWSDDTSSITLEFQPADRVRWFIRIKLDDQVDTAAGTTTVTSLPNILEGFGLRDTMNGPK